MEVSELLEEIVRWDRERVLAALVTLALAFLVAIPVAWDRERAVRTAGLRTFPLVSAASAAFVMIGRDAVSGESGMRYVIQGLMTGLGFLGAGAIIRAGAEHVRGMATAVALWSTAAIGAAVAYGRLEIALGLVAIDLIALRLMRPIKEAIPHDEQPARDDQPSNSRIGRPRKPTSA